MGQSGLGEMGNNTSVTKDLGLALVRVKNLLVAQAKALETCLGWMRTGFGYSHRGDTPSATPAGY